MAKRVKLEWQWSGLCLNRAADTARVSQILMHSCTHAWTGFCESEQTFLRAGRAMSSHSPAASMCSGAATSATSCTHTRLPTWQLHHASFDSLYSDALLNTQMPGGRSDPCRTCSQHLGKSLWHLYVRLLYKIGQLPLKASRVCHFLWQMPLLDILHHREPAVLPDGHQQAASGKAWLLS